MAITVNIYYTGENGSARKFAAEMMECGVVADIRAEISIENHFVRYPRIL